MRPEITALIDQAGAASNDAAAILHTIARMRGDKIQHRHPGPVYAAIVAGLERRGLAGQITLCPHLSYSAPEPAYWCAWAPGRIRCAACAQATQRRIHGTEEDRRCDHCRTIGPTIHADMAQLPPVVINLPPWPPKCIPPVTVLFGLCPACQREDQAAVEHPRAGAPGDAATATAYTRARETTGQEG